MNDIIKKYTDIFFKVLISKYGFEIKTEILGSESYLMEFVSKNYVIKIEKYRLEFYPLVYSPSDPDNEINFFNLLGFLKQGGSKSNFFRKEKDIKECYRKQLNHISVAIYDSLDLLDDFFSKDKYLENILEFHRYWKNKHPELYRIL